MKKKKLENVMPRQCLMMMLNMITCIYYTKDRPKRRENSALAWHQLKEFKTTTFKNFVKPDLDDVPSSSFIVVVFSSQVKGRLLLLLLFEWPSSCNEWVEAENWLFVVVWKGNSKSSLFLIYNYRSPFSSTSISHYLTWTQKKNTNKNKCNRDMQSIDNLVIDQILTFLVACSFDTDTLLWSVFVW